MFSRSFSRLSFSLTFLSLSHARSLSLVLSLSFSLLSRCPSLYLCEFMSLGISMCHARVRARSFTLTPFLSFSLSPFLSLSLALFSSFFAIHICTYQSWQACTQPHLSGLALRPYLMSRYMLFEWFIQTRIHQSKKQDLRLI